jgi:hypothetical protein
VNPSNAAAFQTAAEVHRWRAEWWLHVERDVRGETAAGRRLTSEALRLNPNLANAMVTAAALDVVEAEAASDGRARRSLANRSLEALDRATELDPLLARDPARIADRARALAGAPTE